MKRKSETHFLMRGCIVKTIHIFLFLLSLHVVCFSNTSAQNVGIPVNICFSHEMEIFTEWMQKSSKN